MSAAIEDHAQDAGRATASETLLAGALIIAATAPGMVLMGVSDDPAAPENPIYRLYWVPIYAAAGLLCLARARELARSWAALAVSAALVAWAFLSTAWSILPDVTVRRSFALMMTTLIGVYLGATLSGARLARILAGSSLVLAVGSLLTAILAPSAGVEHEPTLAGDWRGLWSTKNALAEFMALGGTAAISAALCSPRRRGLWIGVGGACVALLLLSRGKTSLLCLLLAAAVAAAVILLRSGPVVAVLTTFVLGALAMWGGFFAVLDPEPLFRAIGKDATLTGRTDIWAAILRQRPDHPSLGFGFGAFWEKDSIPAQIIRKETGWPVPSAHNGWLDLYLQVGGVGVALFAAALTAAGLAVLWRLPRLRDGYFCLMFVMFYLVTSLSESVLEQHNNLPWCLFVAVLTLALKPEPNAPIRAPAAARDPALRLRGA